METVEELRTKLVDLGLTKDEAQNIKGKSDLKKKLDEMTGNVSELDNKLDEMSGEILKENTIVVRTDDGWHNHVMSHFLPDELIPDPKDANIKLPTVDGLRRVTEELIGTILWSKAEVIRGPSCEDRSATVNYEIGIQRHGDSLVLTFGGAADCGPWNSDSVFNKFPTSVAETRAEGRALRKVLGLKKIVAAEEISSQEEEWVPPSDKMTDVQIAVIEKLCKEKNIDVNKFFNHGKSKFTSYKEISKATAAVMVGFLNEYSRGEKSIPEDIKGFKDGWRSE